MMSDADQHERDALERLLDARNKDRKEQKQIDERPSSMSSAQPAFLHSMNRGLYNGEETVEDRLNKYRNHRQRGNIEQQAFL